MMYMFPNFQFSTKMFLHDISMQANIFTINFYGFIFMQWFIQRFKSMYRPIFRQMIFCKAFTRTIFSFVQSIRFTIKNCITNNAVFRRQNLFGLGKSNFNSLLNCKFSLANMRTKKLAILSYIELIITSFTHIHNINYIRGIIIC